MKKLFIVSFIVFNHLAGISQTIYSANSKYDADVKVYVASSKYDADLVVYKCQSKYDADLIIYFTDSKYDAGWRTNEKKHLLY